MVDLANLIISGLVKIQQHDLGKLLDILSKNHLPADSNNTDQQNSSINLLAAVIVKQLDRDNILKLCMWFDKFSFIGKETTDLIRAEMNLLQPTSTQMKNLVPAHNQVVATDITSCAQPTQNQREVCPNDQQQAAENQHLNGQQQEQMTLDQIVKNLLDYANKKSLEEVIAHIQGLEEKLLDQNQVQREAQEQLLEQTKIIQQYKSDIDVLNSKVLEIETKYTDDQADLSINDLNTTIPKQQQNIKEYNINHSTICQIQFHDKLNQSQAIIAQKESEIVDLSIKQRNQVDLETEILAMKTTIFETNSKLQESQQLLDDKSAEGANKTTQINELNEKLIQSQTLIEQKNIEYEAKSNEIDQLTEQIANLQLVLDCIKPAGMSVVDAVERQRNVEQQLLQSEQAVKAQSMTIKQLQEQHSPAQKLFQQSKAINQQQRGKMAVENENKGENQVALHVKHLEAQLIGCQTTIKTQQQTIQKLKDRESIVQQQEAAIQKLQESGDHIKTICELQMINDKQQEEILELSNRVQIQTAKQDEIETLKEQLQQSELMMTSQKLQMESLQTKLSNLDYMNEQQVTSDQVSQISYQQNDKSEFQTKSDRQNERKGLKPAVLQIKLLEARLKEYEKILVDSQKTVQQLQKQNNQVERLKVQLSEQKSIIETQQEEIEDLKQNYEDHNRLNSSEISATKLNYQLQAEVEQLQQKLQEITINKQRDQMKPLMGQRVEQMLQSVNPAEKYKLNDKEVSEKFMVNISSSEEELIKRSPNDRNSSQCKQQQLQAQSIKILEEKSRIDQIKQIITERINSALELIRKNAPEMLSEMFSTNFNIENSNIVQQHVCINKVANLVVQKFDVNEILQLCSWFEKFNFINRDITEQITSAVIEVQNSVNITESFEKATYDRTISSKQNKVYNDVKQEKDDADKNKTVILQNITTLISTALDLIREHNLEKFLSLLSKNGCKADKTDIDDQRHQINKLVITFIHKFDKSRILALCTWFDRYNFIDSQITKQIRSLLDKINPLNVNADNIPSTKVNQVNSVNNSATLISQALQQIQKHDPMTLVSVMARNGYVAAIDDEDQIRECMNKFTEHASQQFNRISITKLCIWFDLFEYIDKSVTQKLRLEMDRVCPKNAAVSGVVDTTPQLAPSGQRSPTNEIKLDALSLRANLIVTALLQIQKKDQSQLLERLSQNGLYAAADDEIKQHEQMCKLSAVVAKQFNRDVITKLCAWFDHFPYVNRLISAKLRAELSRASTNIGLKQTDTFCPTKVTPSALAPSEKVGGDIFNVATNHGTIVIKPTEETLQAAQTDEQNQKAAEQDRPSYSQQIPDQVNENGIQQVAEQSKISDSSEYDSGKLTKSQALKRWDRTFDKEK